MNRRITAVLSVSAFALLAGCADGGRTSAYRLDPTPDLDRLGLEKDVEANNRALSQDTNLRSLNDDMARFWLYDRPSRLSPTGIPY
jgi:hypothetical protein